MLPVVSKSWTEHQDSVMSFLAGETVKLIGDGRCDSPGHSAKYGTYTMMDASTGLIIDHEVVQVSEVSLLGTFSN